jgi:hypothetical protein
MNNMLKNIYIKLLVSACCLCAVCWACKKNQLTVSPYDYTDGKAFFKINYSCPYAVTVPVQLKINGVKVSNGLTYSTPFPGGGLNTGGGNYADYLAINTGTDTVSLSIVKVGTNIDSIALYSTSVIMEDNVYKTLHITDTASNIQSVLLKDAPIRADSGYTQFRFINLIPNSTGIDLYFGTTKMASNIAYKQVTDTFSLAPGSTGSWSLRVAGGSATLGTAYSNTASTANQRIFTIYSRGYIGLPTTDVRSPKVSLIYNK